MKLSLSLSFPDSQGALESKDYGSTLSWALLLLFTSPPPNQPGPLTGVSSRRKQAHLLGLKTERKLRNQDLLVTSLSSALLAAQDLTVWVEWTSTHKVDEFQEKRHLNIRQKHLTFNFKAC